MAKQYRITVFGKSGCDKCKVLNQRIDTLLEKDEWGEFEKNYISLDTEEGLVAFCRTECVNPQRIPAFVIEKLDESTNEYRLLENSDPDRGIQNAANARLYQYVGLQTDYSDQGRGVISPKMIAETLKEARA